MPVRIPNTLPARAILENENIFVMGEERASQQDIRPLRVAILNLMPTKIQTETQLLRLLGNSALQVDVTLLHTTSHKARNTSDDHLMNHYYSFGQIKRRKFDGLIITGAPVEQMVFEEVDYWPELKDILEWAEENVFSTFFICWGAQAGLYHHYSIPKYPLESKKFGVFYHRVLDKKNRLVRGFDDEFLAPHSRHTEIRRDDIDKDNRLTILAESDEAGVYLVASNDGRKVFVTGHSEYDPLTLKGEYDRDIEKGLPINIPSNYFPDDNPVNSPRVGWRSHANLLYMNWLNYFVYQVTPYHLKDIPTHGTFKDF